jgi:hypothetical protein
LSQPCQLAISPLGHDNFVSSSVGTIFLIRVVFVFISK